MERYVAAKPTDRGRIVAETRALGLGRFTDAVRTRVLGYTERSQEFNTLSWELAQLAMAPPQAKAVFATPAPGATPAACIRP
jgi:hypothetical protein